MHRRNGEDIRQPIRVRFERLRFVAQMVYRNMAGGKLDEQIGLRSEAMQQLEALHRPKATTPPFRGDKTCDGEQLLEQKNLADEELEMTKEWQGWAGESQLLPPQQGASFSWNSFLPQRQLRILLVETDDSTRQILSALLGNCNYEVVSVANGLQAWDVLGSPANCIDMVLTEVDMPGLSGVGLLRRINAHTPCRNVAVIMMSSNDSMGLVVSCLTNGAADFLLKPVRKNELSNLWQHVWRRHHNSYGNGNQNGSSHLRASKLKRRGGRSELNVADGSETQSSWTKPVIGEGSPGPKRKKICWNTPDVHPSKKLSTMFADEVSDVNQATSPYMPGPAVPRYEIKMHLEVDLQDAKRKTGSLVINNEGEDDEEPSGTQGLIDRERKKSIDFFDILACQERSKKEQDSNSSDVKGQAGKTLFNAFTEGTTSDSNFLPSLELSLKRQRAAGEIESHENSVLKRSISSAFSRYTNHANSLQSPQNKASPECHAPMVSDNQSLVTENSRNSNRMGTMFTVQMEKNGEIVQSLPMCNFATNGSENQNVGFLPNVVNQDNVPNPLPNNNCTISAVCSAPWSNHTSTSTHDETRFHYKESLHPLLYTHSVTLQKPIPYSLVDKEKPCETGGLNDPMQSCDTSPKVHCHSHHRIHQHQMQVQQSHHHQHQNLPQKNPVGPQPDEQTVADVRCGTLQRGESFTVNVIEGSNNCKNIGYSSECSRSRSFNDSGTASNNASIYVHEKNDVQSGMQRPHGVFAALDTVELGSTRNDTEDDELSKKNGNIMAVASEQNPSLREAALSKFRQKRKERCFQKKVRYLSRKVLAEQRPRVRGQFVRQAVCVPVVT